MGLTEMSHQAEVAPDSFLKPPLAPSIAAVNPHKSPFHGMYLTVSMDKILVLKHVFNFYKSYLFTKLNKSTLFIYILEVFNVQFFRINAYFYIKI